MALFQADTEDEIVINTATGGRTTYKNAGNTRRKGAELMCDGELPCEPAGARRADLPQRRVHRRVHHRRAAAAGPGGHRSCRASRRSSAYGELAWTPGGYGGFNAAVEVQYVGQLYVNDRNTDAGAGVHGRRTCASDSAQTVGRVALREFVRVNNVVRPQLRRDR